jgi:DNA-binding NtrC family response regulator
MPPLDAAPSGQRKTVLAVDDDPDALNLCRLFLEKAGFSVLSAAGSSEALKICKTHAGPIDLLITDLVMPPPDFSFASGDNEFPHVHGHDLAVRALHMRKELHVILMSANIDKELQGYGIRRGDLPFITKPLDARALVSLAHDTLQTPPPTVESLQKEQTGGIKGADEWFD